MSDKVFTEKSKMPCDAIFEEDGSIHIYPIPLAESIDVTMGEPVRQRGACVTTTNGETHFKPYGTGAKRSTNLFCTAHGMVSRTKKSCIVRFQFPKDMNPNQIANLFITESRKIGLNLLTSKILEEK